MRKSNAPASSAAIGKRFGLLTVVGISQRRYSDGRMLLDCRCDCGNTATTHLSNLKDGRAKSCGCLKAKRLRAQSLTHGLSHTREYKIWKGMRARCQNPRNTSYADYGGRGIRVCSRWADFDAFLQDMGTAPTRHHSIDRIDADGPYSPKNCQWATPTQQVTNRRNPRVFNLRGRWYTLNELADAMRVPRSGLSNWLIRYGDHWIHFLTSQSESQPES